MITLEDFLAAEQRSERRHELVGGRVWVMAGRSERHDLVTGLVYEALASGARGAGCHPFTSNRLLRSSHAAHYPDVLIAWGRPDAGQVLGGDQDDVLAAVLRTRARSGPRRCSAPGPTRAESTAPAGRLQR